MDKLSDKPVSIIVLMSALLVACTAFQLNASMLSPVLVTIAKELHTNDAVVGLSQTAFFTAAALFSLFLPRLSDIIGRKKVLSWMLIIMTLGTMLAAIAPDISVLYIARIIQGVSGPVVPLCLLMLRHEISDPKKYGMLMGVVTAVNGGIAGIDAFLGGVLAANFGFRSVFWVITAIAALASFCVASLAPESRPSAGTKMDWTGVLLLVASLAGLLLALNEAGKPDRVSWLMVGVLVIFSLTSFIIFYNLETRLTQPLVTITHLKQRSTWALLLTTTLAMTGIFAIINGLVMSWAQNKDAGFALEADLASVMLLTPYALAGWLIGPFSGRLAGGIGYNTVLRIGLTGSIISIILMMFFGLNSLTMLVASAVLTGITYAGISNIMLNGLGIVLSPENNPGFLPGMNAGAFNLGAGLSFAILPAVQIISGTSRAGYFNGMLVGLIITIMALLSSLMIPEPVNVRISH